MTSSDNTLNASTDTSKRSRRVVLSYISRTAAPGINDTAFRLLRRIAALTRNGKQPCNYPNSQALKELGLSGATTERCFKALAAAGYVNVTRGRNLAINAGYHIRTVELIAKEGLFND